MNKQSHIAQAYLILVTALWGLTFPLIHDAVRILDPYWFVSIRFALAAVVLAPFIIKSALKYTNRGLLLGGLIIGALAASSYVTQSIGLQTIPASRAAFIAGMSVLLVPFLAPFFGLGKPRSIEFLSALICLGGLYILTNADLNHLQFGDLISLLSAFIYALTILSIQRLSLYTKHYLLVSFYQLAFCFLTSLCFLPLAKGDIHWHTLFMPRVLLAIAFCAVLASALVIYLQLRYQQYVSAPKAAIIYALEPVFASVFSLFLNNESVTVSLLLGGSLVVLSIMLPEVYRLKFCKV